MKKKLITPNVTLIIGFIFLNVLASIMYRYSEWFKTANNFNLWLLLVVIATVILFWGIKTHFDLYNKRDTMKLSK